jgi:hypothetical protein
MSWRRGCYFQLGLAVIAWTRRALEVFSMRVGNSACVSLIRGNWSGDTSGLQLMPCGEHATGRV